MPGKNLNLPLLGEAVTRQYRLACELYDTYPLPHHTNQLSQGILILDLTDMDHDHLEALCHTIGKKLSPVSVHVKTFPGKEVGAKILQRSIEGVSVCVALSLAITSLDLFGIRLKGKNLDVLCQGLSKSKTLKNLSMRMCALGDSGAELVCQSVKNVPSITHLILITCHLTPRGASAIASLIQHQQLNRDSAMWQDTLRQREPHLDGMRGLRRITLNNNPQLGDAGVMVLAQALTEDLWIKAVDVQNCGVGSEGGDAMISLVKNNQVLEVVDIRRNPFIPQQMLEDLSTKLQGRKNTYDQQYKWMEEDEGGQGEAEAIVRSYTTTGRIPTSSRRSLRPGFVPPSKRPKAPGQLGIPWRVEHRLYERREGLAPGTMVDQVLSEQPDDMEEAAPESQPTSQLVSKEATTFANMKKQIEDYKRRYQKERKRRKRVEEKLNHLKNHVKGRHLLEEEAVVQIEECFMVFQSFLSHLQKSGYQLQPSEFPSGVKNHQPPNSQMYNTSPGIHPNTLIDMLQNHHIRVMENSYPPSGYPIPIILHPKKPSEKRDKHYIKQSKIRRDSKSVGTDSSSEIKSREIRNADGIYYKPEVKLATDTRRTEDADYSSEAEVKLSRENTKDDIDYSHEDKLGRESNNVYDEYSFETVDTTPDRDIEYRKSETSRNTNGKNELNDIDDYSSEVVDTTPERDIEYRESETTNDKNIEVIYSSEILDTTPDRDVEYRESDATNESLNKSEEPMPSPKYDHKPNKTAVNDKYKQDKIPVSENGDHEQEKAGVIGKQERTLVYDEDIDKDMRDRTFDNYNNKKDNEKDKQGRTRFYRDYKDNYKQDTMAVKDDHKQDKTVGDTARLRQSRMAKILSRVDTTTSEAMKSTVKDIPVQIYRKPMEPNPHRVAAEENNRESNLRREKEEEEEEKEEIIEEEEEVVEEVAEEEEKDEFEDDNEIKQFKNDGEEEEEGEESSDIGSVTSSEIKHLMSEGEIELTGSDFTINEDDDENIGYAEDLMLSKQAISIMLKGKNKLADSSFNTGLQDLELKNLLGIKNLEEELEEEQEDEYKQISGKPISDDEQYNIRRAEARMKEVREHYELDPSNETSETDDEKLRNIHSSLHQSGRSRSRSSSSVSITEQLSQSHSRWSRSTKRQNKGNTSSESLPKNSMQVESHESNSKIGHEYKPSLHVSSQGKEKYNPSLFESSHGLNLNILSPTGSSHGINLPSPLEASQSQRGSPLQSGKNSNLLQFSHPLQETTQKFRKKRLDKQSHVAESEQIGGMKSRQYRENISQLKSKNIAQLSGVRLDAPLVTSGDNYESDFEGSIGEESISVTSLATDDLLTPGEEDF